MRVDDFKHIIVTRFNCRFGDLPKHLQIESPASAQWLKDRFVLFERYCLPTLLSQTCDNFTWFIYFDDETPHEYLEHARGLLKERANMIVKTCNAFTTEVLRQDINSLMTPACRHLITTRLDNDDGLRTDFVARLQSEVRFREREALNFPLGIVFGREKTYLSRQASNAFISVSEPYDKDILTVYCGSHNQMAARIAVRDIGESEPAWLQVIHGGNVSNKLRGNRIPLQRGSLGFVPLETRARAVSFESPVQIFMENASVSLIWALRDKAARAYRSFRR